MQLMNSERFVKEYNELKTRIAAVTDINVHDQLNNYLSQLVNAVRTLDSQHQELVFNPKLPDSINILRETIRDNRRKITQMLDSWERKSKNNV
jgi:hypothetical protein